MRRTSCMTLESIVKVSPMTKAVEELFCVGLVDWLRAGDVSDVRNAATNRYDRIAFLTNVNEVPLSRLLLSTATDRRLCRIAELLVQLHSTNGQTLDHRLADGHVFGEREIAHLILAANADSLFDIPKTLPSPKTKEHTLVFCTDQHHRTGAGINEVTPLHRLGQSRRLHNSRSKCLDTFALPTCKGSNVRIRIFCGDGLFHESPGWIAAVLSSCSRNLTSDAVNVESETREKTRFRYLTIKLNCLPYRFRVTHPETRVL